MEKIKVVTLCSGYDSQCMALDEIKKMHPGFDYELAAWSEIDKYAIQMHDIIYPQWADRNVGDMTTCNWQPIKDKYGEIDILFYSTPCTDISNAGKQQGFSEGAGTRSSVLWSTEEAIRILKPKYLLQENVKAIIQGRPNMFKKDKDGNMVETFWSHLCKWMQRVESYGYHNDWAIINAKDQGVPQNRERFFLLSQRNDVYKPYSFPRPMPLTKHLEDILEEEVEDKYFLNDDSVGKFLKANDKDDAVFHQFAIPPTHEDAMFLKTMLQLFIDAMKGWENTPSELEELLDDFDHQFYSIHKIWKETGKFPSEEFERLFNDNMKRNKDEL